MRKIKRALLAVTMSGLTGPIWAADFSDPTWPCIQRKVETLSLGLMWAHEVDPSLRAADGELATDAASLADLLALRRVELSDLEDDVAAFGAKYDGNAQSLGLVFELVFDRLSKRRGRIIGGIGEFSLSQIALAEQIDANRLAFDTEMAAAAPDFDKVDALEEKIDWDQVIYSDRQRSITYLCETPQLIEKRLFAIAQMLSYQVE